MLDLDKYLNDGVDIKLFGKEVTLKMLTYKDTVEIGKLEEEMRKEDITAEKANDIRAKITLIMLDNNAQNIKFDINQIKNKMPVKLQVALANLVAKFIYKLENDPN